MPPVERGVHEQVVQRRPVPVLDRDVQHVARARLARDVQRHDLVVVQRAGSRARTRPRRRNGVSATTAASGRPRARAAPSRPARPASRTPRAHRRGIIGQRGRRGPPGTLPRRLAGRRPPRERGRSGARTRRPRWSRSTAGSSRRSTAPGIPGEVIFVDDGSTEATFERMSRAAARRRTRACGWCRSIATTASTRRCTPASPAPAAEIVVTMDGDLQNQPADIPQLVAAVEAGADVASGRAGERRDPMLRRLPSARDQPHAGPPDRRRPDRLRLRVQRLPARRARAGDAPDRPAEVHQGARLLDRRARRRGRPRPPRPRAGRSRYGAGQPGQAGPPGPDRVLGPGSCSGWGILGVVGILTSLGVGVWGWSTGSATTTRPASLLLGGAGPVRAGPARRPDGDRGGATCSGSSATPRGGRCTTSNESCRRQTR